MWTAKVRESGDGQVIRLPGEIRFEAHEVLINKVDEMVILFPRKKGWDLLATALDRFTEDFMAKRRQPARTDKRA
jgi:virulence-associated protein VagC